MDNRQRELSDYRLNQAEESLEVAKNCCDKKFYKNSINRSYYSVFYSIKAVLSLDSVDFKRHKDVIGYFNKEYVATGVFPRMIGRNIGILKQIREDSDYDDFYIASKEEAYKQIETANLVLDKVKEYLKING